MVPCARYLDVKSKQMVLISKTMFNLWTEVIIFLGIKKILSVQIKSIGLNHMRYSRYNILKNNSTRLYRFTRFLPGSITVTFMPVIVIPSQMDIKIPEETMALFLFTDFIINFRECSLAHWQRFS